jgi:hypothetical protein
MLVEVGDALVGIELHHFLKIVPHSPPCFAAREGLRNPPARLSFAP